MLVLHGIWVYGALWLWAEDSGRPADSAPRPGRPSRAPRLHPFGCDVSLLTDALAELAYPVTDLARKAVEDELTLFLPSTPAGPVGSPALIRPVTSDAGHGQQAAAQRTGGRRPALAAWRIPALVFEPAAALTLLTALGKPVLGGPGSGEPGSGSGEPGSGSGSRLRGIEPWSSWLRASWPPGSWLRANRPARWASSRWRPRCPISRRWPGWLTTW